MGLDITLHKETLAVHFDDSTSAVAGGSEEKKDKVEASEEKKSEMEA